MEVRRHFTRGLMAGFLAAAAFAAWFLLFDAARSQPFFTPVYISRFVLASPTLSIAARVAVFTLIHFTLFGLAGILASLLLEISEITPTVPLGLVYGFILFDVAFYASVMLLGVNVVSALGWPLVLSGNVLAGGVMFGYLRAREGRRVFDLRGALTRSVTLKRGLIDGIIGGVIVAVWFLVIDALRGRMLFTPAALGSALFFGASSPGDVTMQASVILAYTVVHFAVFIALGLLVAWLAEEAEHNAPLVLGIVLFFVTLEVLTLGLFAAAAAWLFRVVPWWSPIVGNLLAAAGMIAYLWAVHPELRQRLRQPIEEPDFHPPGASAHGLT